MECGKRQQCESMYFDRYAFTCFERTLIKTLERLSTEWEGIEVIVLRQMRYV